MLFNWTCFICFNWTFNLQFYCLRKGWESYKEWYVPKWRQRSHLISSAKLFQCNIFKVCLKIFDVSEEDLFFSETESLATTSFKTYFHWLQNSVSPGQPQDVEGGSLAAPLCPTRRWPPPRGSREDGLGGREVFKWSSQRRKSEYLEVLWKVCLRSFCQRQDFSNTLCLLPNTLELLQKEAFFMVI